LIDRFRGDASGQKRLPVQLNNVMIQRFETWKKKETDIVENDLLFLEQVTSKI
jgi:hypothetical protein